MLKKEPLLRSHPSFNRYSVVFPNSTLLHSGCGPLLYLDQRSGNRAHPGFWVQLSGKLESSQTPEQVMKQEVYEELELVISIPRYLG